MTVLAHSPSMTVADRLKDGFSCAFIGLLLGIPMLGLTTVDEGGALRVMTRWPSLALFVGIVFVGRIVLQMIKQSFARRRASRPAKPRGAVEGSSRIQSIIGWGGLGLAAAMPIVFSDNRYVVDTATTVLIYVMLGWGLNVVVGLAGLLDLGYVAFYAVGAYTYALLSTQFGWGFWEALPVAGGVAASFGVILGWPTLRLRGDYLAIVTLGFGEIIRLILVNWTDFSGGPNGISSIPRPGLFGFTFSPPGSGTSIVEALGIDYAPTQRIVFLYYVILALALLTNLFVRSMRKLPTGRAWEAVREDEIACKAMGINVTNVKLAAFAIGAMLGGFAGVFFAARQGFISPESFTFSESAIILAIVVLGGMGSQMGVVLASLVLVLLPELGRDFAEYRMLLFGTAMVLIMVWRPGGILSHRAPTLVYVAPGEQA